MNESLPWVTFGVHIIYDRLEKVSYNSSGHHQTAFWSRLPRTSVNKLLEEMTISVGAPARGHGLNLHLNNEVPHYTELMSQQLLQF